MNALNLTVMTRSLVNRRPANDDDRLNAGAMVFGGFDAFPFPRNLRHREAAKRDNRRSSWWAGHQMSCFR